MELLSSLLAGQCGSLKSLSSFGASPFVVPLSSGLYGELCSAVSLWYDLTRRDNYLACRGEYGAVKQKQESVLMGYDFHIVKGRPKLIEVNTNAGGLLFALLQEGMRIREGSLPQKRADETEEHLQSLAESFTKEYALYLKERGEKNKPLRRIAIVDDNVETGVWSREFTLYAALFSAYDIETVILPVSSLELEGDTLRGNGKVIDMVYNRWCDFYLEEETSVPLREAYFKGYACVSPNPVEYHRSADKEVFTLFSDTCNDERFGITPEERQQLDTFLPETRLLSSFDFDELKRRRKKLFFKPMGLYGGKGTYRGDKISVKKLAELPKERYLVQELSPPDTLEFHGKSYKYDIRLLAYRGEVIAPFSRLFQGQVMEFRSEGSGYAPVYITEGA